jgi:hypothetical protein
MQRTPISGHHGTLLGIHIANHGLSSQVCCLNFLLPLATNPKILAKVVENVLGLAPLKMLQVEDGPSGQPYYIGFEWIGRKDYLGEWPAGGNAKRGAHVTSSDAFIRFEHQGQFRGFLLNGSTLKHTAHHLSQAAIANE